MRRLIQERASPWATVTVAVLAIAFLLGAADPTPRFLGFPRAPGLGRDVAPQRGEVPLRPVLASYDLPPCVCAQAGPNVESVDGPLGLAQHATTPWSDSTLRHLSPPSIRRAPLAAPGRNGSGPPLRC